jgi:hypothetical protein
MTSAWHRSIFNFSMVFVSQASNSQVNPNLVMVLKIASFLAFFGLLTLCGFLSPMLLLIFFRQNVASAFEGKICF